MTLPPQSKWFAPNMERQSLEYFRITLDEYIQPIKNSVQKLEGARSPFGAKDILPFHCRRAIKVLMESNAVLANCCQFLRQTDKLPVAMLALRYQLMDDLSYAKEQSEMLMMYLDERMSVSTITFQQSTHQEQIIEELFDKILQLLRMIPTQSGHLFSEARFQEKRLANLTSGISEQKQRGTEG